MSADTLPAIPDAFDPATDILVTREFAHPLARVWSAWTDPKKLPLWWGPEGFTCATHEIDIRNGGQWRFTMTGPDGTRYPNRLRYLALVPEARIDYAIDDDGAGRIAFGARARFSAHGSVTRVEMHSRFDSPETLAAVEKFGAREGGHSTLACLAAFLDGEG